MVAVLVYNGKTLCYEVQLDIPLSDLIAKWIEAGYKITETYEGRRIVRMVAIGEPNNAYELFYLGGD